MWWLHWRIEGLLAHVLCARPTGRYAFNVMAFFGGERGIRTLVRLAPPTDFESGPFGQLRHLSAAANSTAIPAFVKLRPYEPYVSASPSVILVPNHAQQYSYTTFAHDSLSVWQSPLC